MEFNLLSARKGQIAIEFILILIIMLIYIQTMIQPMLDSSINSIEEVSRLGQTRAATQKLVNAVDYVALSNGDAKQTISFYLPPNASITCQPASFIFSSRIAVPHESCMEDLDPDESTLCTQSIPVLGVASIECRDFGSNGVISTMGTAGIFYEISVRKSEEVIYVAG